MSKPDLVHENENFILESLWSKYLLSNGSGKTRKGTDSADRLSGKNAHDEIIDRFIDQYCVKQIKNRVPLKELMNRIERVILTIVLSQFNGHKTNASRFLGIKTTTLHEKMKKHKIGVVKIVQ